MCYCRPAGRTAIAVCADDALTSGGANMDIVFVVEPSLSAPLMALA
jgi:hypothetical protein